MDLLNVVIRADTSGSDKAAQSLDNMTSSAKQADAAVRNVGTGSAIASGAIGQSAAATDRATASDKAREKALQAVAAAERMAGMQRRNLMFQLNDVGVSLAGGMNPLMVLVQQGSQIATIYDGGVVPALRETGRMAAAMATRFAPLGLAIGAVTAVMAGLTHEINETASTQVSMLDVMQAGWQLFAEGVAGLMAPLFSQIGTWLQQGWDLALPILKGIGNTIIGAFAFAIQAVGSLWNGLPAAVGDAIIKTANVVISGLEWTINTASEFINGFIEKYNTGLAAMGQQTLPTFGGVNIPRASNPYEGAMGTLGTDIGANASSAFSTDYMGSAFGALSERAQKIAGAKKEIEEVGSAASAANDNVKKLATDGLTAALEKAKEFGAAIGDAMKNLLKDVLQGNFSLQSLGDALSAIGDKLFDIGWSMLSGGLGAGGGAAGGGIFGWLGSLFGFADGGVFLNGNVQAFARGGVVSKPTMFPMATGMGLMGEAGPEAIMPLRRGPDGRLGVAASNQNQSQALHVTLGIAEDGNGNILPFVQSVSRQEARQAAAAGTQVAIAQSAKQGPSAMARHQQQRGGSDYRTM